MMYDFRLQTLLLLSDPLRTFYVLVVCIFCTVPTSTTIFCGKKGRFRGALGRRLPDTVYDVASGNNRKG